MSHDIPVKEISELIEVASDKIPTLISGLLKTVYSEEAGTNMGRAVGSFYKELLAAGIPQEQALTMSTNYMITVKDMIQQQGDFRRHQHHWHPGHHDPAN